MCEVLNRVSADTGKHDAPHIITMCTAAALVSIGLNHVGACPCTRRAFRMQPSTLYLTDAEIDTLEAIARTLFANDINLILIRRTFQLLYAVQEFVIYDIIIQSKKAGRRYRQLSIPFTAKQ